MGISWTWLGLAGGILAADLPAAEGRVPGTILVKAILGQAYAKKTGGDEWTALQSGDAVGLGDIVYAGPDSAVDLFLGADAGYLRLTQETQLTLEDYSVDASFRQTDLSLILRTGAVVGFSNHVADAAEYKIKMNHGVVGVAATQFRVDARGFFVCLDGALIYAHPLEDGTVQSEVLKAPPATYYTRGAGVRTAPAPLIQEVLAQTTGGLPKTPGAARKSGSASSSRARPAAGARQSLTEPSGFSEGVPDRSGRGGRP